MFFSQWFFPECVCLKEFFFFTSVLFFSKGVFFFFRFFQKFFSKLCFSILLSNMQMFLRFSIYDVSSKRFFLIKGVFLKKKLLNPFFFLKKKF